MIKFLSKKAVVITALSVSLNIILLGYCLYLRHAIKIIYHVEALGHANIELGVLGGLESGRTNSAVELLELRLRGDKAIIETDPQLTPQTPKVLDKLRTYRWKYADPGAKPSE